MPKGGAELRSPAKLERMVSKLEGFGAAMEVILEIGETTGGGGGGSGRNSPNGCSDEMDENINEPGVN